MILICGNGGLSTHAAHFAAELTGVFYKDVFVPCIDLGSNEAQLTALTNDIGWENVYSHLVSVFGKKGDTFIGLTTSDALNIRNACEKARQLEMNVLYLNKDNLIGNDTAEKQEYALHYLHELAKRIKDKYAR